MAEGPTYVDIAGVVRPRYVTIGGIVRPIWVVEGAIWKTAKYIFSCKKVVSSYTGNCMQIQKSGGATQEVGFDGSGVRDASTISTYAAGTNTNINHFYDQLGSGVVLQNTLQQWYAYYSSAVTSDSNGNPSVYCPQQVATRYLTTSSSLNTSSGGSLSFFGEYKAYNNGRESVYARWGSKLLTSYGFSAQTNEGINSFTYWQSGGGNYTFPTQQPRAYAWTVGTSSSTTNMQFANGSVTLTTLSAASGVLLNPAGVAIGSHAPVRGLGTDAHVSELIIWEADLAGQTAAMISDTQSRYT